MFPLVRATHDSVGEPLARLDAYTSTMPRNAIATPTEPRTTYFQAASVAPRVPAWPTRNAVAIVVASTATHMTPRLSESTAKLMAARNAQIRASLRTSSDSADRPPHRATTATAPTHRSTYEEVASARSTEEVTTCPFATNPMPQARITRATASGTNRANASLCRHAMIAPRTVGTRTGSQSS